MVLIDFIHLDRLHLSVYRQGIHIPIVRLYGHLPIRNMRGGPRMGWWCVRLYQWYVTWSSHHCGRVTLACDTQWLVTVTRHTVSHVTRDTGHWGSGLEVTSGHTQSTHQTCVADDVTLTDQNIGTSWSFCMVFSQHISSDFPHSLITCTWCDAMSLLQQRTVWNEETSQVSQK